MKLGKLGLGLLLTSLVLSCNRADSDPAETRRGELPQAQEQELPQAQQEELPQAQQEELPQDPPRAILRAKDDNTYAGNEKEVGMPRSIEFYFFDKEKGEVSPPSGSVLTMGESPIPMVILSMSANLTGSACAKHENIVLDIKNIPLDDEDRSRFRLGHVYSEQGEVKEQIFLKLGDLEEVYVSPSYTVYPGKSRKIDDGGPFVTLRFDIDSSVRSEAKELTIDRNGKEIWKIDLDSETSFDLLSVRRSNDLITWSIRDHNGKALEQGLVAFLVAGASPGLVEYVTEIGF